MNHENWSIAKPRKSISFLPSSVDRKVVETVDMVQTVSLQLPVDKNSIPQVSNGPIWKISKNIFIVWPREPSYECSKWFWEGDSYYCTWIVSLIWKKLWVGRLHNFISNLTWAWLQKIPFLFCVCLPDFFYNLLLI